MGYLHRIIFFCLIWALQADISLINAQEIDFQNYVITRFEMKDGLPQSSVNDIIQTRDGYIWLATFGGLVRFDGNTFTTFNRSNTKGMRSDRILNLYEDHEGAIWLSTEDVIIRLLNGEYSSFDIPQESQVFTKSKIIEDANNVLWLSINEKPYKFEDGSFVSVPVIKDKYKAEKAIMNPGGVWIKHERKILRTLGDSVVQILDLSSELDNYIVDMIEFPEGSGTYFIGTSGDGVVRYKDGKLTFFTEDNGLPSNDFWHFNIDRNNNLWVSSYDGLSIWDDSVFVPFTAITETKEIQVSKIFQDNERNYWIGTRSKGLLKIRPSIISTISKNDGLLNESMLSLTELKDGTYLFATNCGGIYEWNGNAAISSSINKLMPNQCVWSIFQDSKNRIWFGSRVLYRSNSLEEPGVVFDSTKGFTGIDIFAITEDSRGNIWIGALNGLFVFDGKEFRRYTTTDGLSFNDTRVIFEDDKGKMWIGTSEGLNTIQNNTVRNVKLLENAGDSKQAQEPYIRAIYKDEGGTMWFGSYGNGLFRLKDGKTTNITTKQGLFDDIVSHIVEDDQGNFWMGSNRGIFRASKKELNDLSDGRRESVNSYSYGVADGMYSSETNGGFQPSVISDSLGNIYFPTVEGVAIVSTGKVEDNNIPPKVYIENLRSSEEEIPFSSAITLPYDNAFLEIDYTALSFTAPKKVQFRYMLEGFDDSWINVQDRRVALYSKIPPGDYTFKVIASNNDGVWNEEGASLRVTITPPFWQTNWFYGIIGFLFLSFGPIVYYYRVQQLKKENERQKMFTGQLIASQENERRRIASELHDGLGQQILVIKNRVELAKKQLNNPSELSDQLNEIMQSAVTSISDVRTISHGLRPVHLEKFGLTEAITNLCNELQETSTIEWSYHIDNVDKTIPEKKEINFFRVLQEGINNILKHSSASEASVLIKRNEDNIYATLWDDGKGFNIRADEQKEGLGFLGMRERVQTLGGTINIQSMKGKGTTIKINIPIAENV